MSEYVPTGVEANAQTAPAIPTYTQAKTNLNSPLNTLQNMPDLSRLLSKVDSKEDSGINLGRKINTDELKGLYNEKVMPLNYINQNRQDFSNLSKPFKTAYLPQAIKGAINLSNMFNDPRNPASFFTTENGVARWFKKDIAELIKEKNPKLAEIINEDNYDSFPIMYVLSKLYPEMFTPSKEVVEQTHTLVPYLSRNDVEFLTNLGLNSFAFTIFGTYGPINPLNSTSDIGQILRRFTEINNGDEKLRGIGEKICGTANPYLNDPRFIGSVGVEHPKAH